MDQFASDYQEADYSQGTDNLVEGDYRVRIDRVDMATAKTSGNPMIVVELAIAQASFTFRYNLVKNEYFNVNATKFFDCFTIPRGNFEYNRWVGRIGQAHIAKGKVKDNGKSYWEIAYLIVPEGSPKPVSQPPRAAVPPPARQAPRATDADFVDDVPF